MKNLGKLASAVLLIAAAYCCSLAMFALSIGSMNSARAIVLAYVVPSVLAAVMLLSAFWLRPALRVSAALSLVVFAVVLFPIELYFSAPERRLGRNNYLLVDAWRARQTGIEAYPLILPSFSSYGRTPLSSPGSSEIPLAYISNELTFLCNRDVPSRSDGLIFMSDEYGFRNSPGAAHHDRIDIAFVGDSFTQGECVSWRETLWGRIGSTFPRTRNFGLTGAGPLWELGVFREYVAPLRPRVTIWVYFEGNDLENADVERGGILANYMSAAYTRQLLSKQEELNVSMRGYVDEAYGDVDRRRISVRVRDLLMLREFRHRLGLAARRDRRPGELLPTSGTRLEDVVEVVRKSVESAKVEAAGWDGQILFVYLPEEERYNPALPRDTAVLVESHSSGYPLVMNMIQSLGIQTVDMVKVFDALPQPTDYWAPKEGHFTPEGYALVADSILTAITRMK